jgi:hypothetical protein
MLTKTDFKIYMEAPLHLWALKHNQYFKQESEYDIHLSKQGYEVEKLAREYVKKYISGQAEFQKIYQTDDLYSRADIVVGNDIYEVKSVTKISKEEENDILFQYYTGSNCVNKRVENIYVIYLNKEYIRHGSINLKELFVVKDMTQFAKDNYNRIGGEIAQALTIESKNDPRGLTECYKPDDCPCKKLCFPTLPQYSIYDIGNISEKKVRQLRDTGILDMKLIPDTFKLTAKQNLQVKATKRDSAVIDEVAVRNDLYQLVYPIYFLDYETYSWAVPRYENHGVYQNVVFQYSLHIKKDDHSPLEHYEYISKTQDDPMKEIAPNLEKVIGKVGSILVWNKSFEMSRNKEMGNIFPKYEDFLIMINSRIKDLGDIFSKQMYVDPEFKGSWSIKKVLPVICPNLTYHGMKVANGTQAMTTWEDIVYGSKTQTEKEEMTKDLLKYCELDTYAMVAIWEAMKLV